jgi:flagellar motility protein MotE (MotC chaperone)
MKSIISAVITCVILFGVSVMTTTYLHQPDSAAKAEITETGSDPADDPPDSSAGAASAMPVSLRPEQAVSVEAVLQMSDSIKQMEQQLMQREQEVLKQEQRLKLLFDDLVTEQDELRAFSEGIDAKVDMLNQMSGTLKATLEHLEARKLELVELEKKTGSDPVSKQQEMDSRVNDVKSWFADLQAEQAADYLKEFANNGKLEFAASLLQKMPDRQKSKILGVMSDPVLVDQLIDSLIVRPKQND